MIKRGRTTKQSISCPEPGRNWMKDEDAYSASLHCSKLWAKTELCYLETLIIVINMEHFILHLHVHYGGKSYTTYWFLVLLCY